MPADVPLYCSFALTSNSNVIEREGVSTLPALAQTIAKTQRVVLLIAASDVTLLRLKTPPLSVAKLRAALPNLVEDQLVTAPEECVVIAGDVVEGLRTVAVVQRDWLERLGQTLLSLGARSIVALPAQLCLPYQAGSVTVAVTEQGTDIDLTLRLSQQEGIGLPILPEQPEAMAMDVLQTVCTVAPQAPIILYVPQARERVYQEALTVATLNTRITLFADNWPMWIAAAAHVSLNLMAGSSMTAGAALNWRPWHWPLMLAGTLLLTNIAGLNSDWWRMKREAEELRTGMIQIYKSAYPKETVIVDPIAQMRQKLAIAQRESGQSAPDDFLALAAALGEAWISSGAEQQTASSAIAGLEYRDRSLFVKLKVGNTMPIEPLKTALKARHLALSSSASGTWQIRSTK